MNTQLKTVLLLSLALWLPATQGQGTDSGSEKRRITFTCASWEQMNEELYFIKGGSAENPEFEKIRLSVMSRSLPYTVSVAESLAFYKKSVDPEREIEGYTKVADVRIPEGLSRSLLLFLPKDGERFRIQALPDDRKDSPFGAYAFYNFTKLNVLGLLGEQKFEIPAYKNSLIQLKLKRGESIPYYAYAEIDGENRWLQRNTFHFNPEKHTKFFIYPVQTTNGSVKVKAKAITEFKQ